MSCCGDKTKDNSLLNLIKSRQVKTEEDTEDCARKQYCTLRECVNDKSGVDATIPAEYMDKLNDILARLAALENDTNKTITIPGGRYLLTSKVVNDVAMCVIPFSGYLKGVIISSDYAIAEWALTRNSSQLTSQGTNGEYHVSYYTNQRCVKHDLLRVALWYYETPGDEETVKRALSRESPLQIIEQQVENDRIVTTNEVEVFEKTGVLPTSARYTAKGAAVTFIFDGDEAEVAYSTTTLPIPMM